MYKVHIYKLFTTNEKLFDCTFVPRICINNKLFLINAITDYLESIDHQI